MDSKELSTVIEKTILAIIGLGLLIASLFAWVYIFVQDWKSGIALMLILWASNFVNKNK
jgi:hypothetical protein